MIFKLSKLCLFVLLLLLVLLLCCCCCCCLFVAILMRSVVTLLLWLLLFLLQVVAKSLSYSRNTSLFSSGQCSIYVASFILTGPNLCGCCTLDIASCNHISIPLSHSHSVSPARSLISYVYFMRPAPLLPWLTD